MPGPLTLVAALVGVVCLALLAGDRRATDPEAPVPTRGDADPNAIELDGEGWL